MRLKLIATLAAPQSIGSPQAFVKSSAYLAACTWRQTAPAPGIPPVFPSGTFCSTSLGKGPSAWSATGPMKAPYAAFCAGVAKTSSPTWAVAPAPVTFGGATKGVALPSARPSQKTPPKQRNGEPWPQKKESEGGWGFGKGLGLVAGRPPKGGLNVA